MPLGYPFVLPNEYDRRGGKHPETSHKTPPYNSTLVDRGFRSLRAMDVRFMVSEEFLPFCRELVPWTKELFSQMENKELKAIVVLMVILVFTFIQFVRYVL